MMYSAFTARSQMAAQPSCRRRIWQLHPNSVPVHAAAVFVHGDARQVTFKFGAGSRGCRFRTDFMSARPSCRRRIWQLHPNSVSVHAAAVFVSTGLTGWLIRTLQVRSVPPRSSGFPSRDLVLRFCFFGNTSPPLILLIPGTDYNRWLPQNITVGYRCARLSAPLNITTILVSIY